MTSIEQNILARDPAIWAELLRLVDEALPAGATTTGVTSVVAHNDADAAIIIDVVNLPDAVAAAEALGFVVNVREHEATVWLDATVSITLREPSPALPSATAHASSSDAAAPRVTAASSGTATELIVLPIIYLSDLAPTAALLEALGLKRRTKSNSETWIDFASENGLIALHRAEPQPHAEPHSNGRIEASFEFAGDLDEFCRRLTDAGIDAAIHDEAYNRTMLVTTPDRSALWVNGRQTDFYGYQTYAT